MRRLYVELDDRAFDRLATLALKERRDVRDQAAVLLEEATKRPAPSARAGRMSRDIPLDGAGMPALPGAME
jgi:hypothetical protein